ncbi:MAG: polyprenyl synthetase family protein [Flavobacteriales bacterium]
MEIFEDKFRSAMRSRVPLLDRITHYIVRRKGKQMRPMFVFLVSKMLGDVEERTYRAASLIELIHTATLVHDDVVDDSNMRRGFFSINALWKNKIAILVGDYLLSKSLLMAVDHNDHDLLKVVSRSIKEMSEGELLQIEKARKLDITESVYYEIIRMKTATLIASCCEGGARSVNVSEEQAKMMRHFGECIGMAFQIKDDLFDYQKTNLIGKPVGIDIQERKMTLPLIYAINHASEKDKKWLIQSIKKYNKDKKRVGEVIDYVKRSGGIEYSIEKMKMYQKEALQIISNQPESPAKESLIEMINYVIEREK